MKQSLSKEFVVSNAAGLHLRSAAQVAKTAGEFNANVTLQHADQQADAKSLLSLLTLGISQGVNVTVCAAGEDADEAISAMKALFEADFAVTEASTGGVTPKKVIPVRRNRQI